MYCKLTVGSALYVCFETVIEERKCTNKKREFGHLVFLDQHGFQSGPTGHQRYCIMLSLKNSDIRN